MGSGGVTDCPAVAQTQACEMALLRPGHNRPLKWSLSHTSNSCPRPTLRQCCLPPLFAQHVSSNSLLWHNVFSGFHRTPHRTSIVPQHMQCRSFGNREPWVHDRPPSETHDEISTRSGKTVHSTSALAHWASQFVKQCSLFQGHHVFQAIGNYDVMLDVPSQHHLRICCDQINAFLSLSRTPPLSRVRYVPRQSRRLETTDHAMLCRVEQTCACQKTRFP